MSNIPQMVSDPEFMKLSASDQQGALSQIDPSFGKLSPEDFAGSVTALQKQSLTNPALGTLPPAAGPSKTMTALPSQSAGAVANSLLDDKQAPGDPSVARHGILHRAYDWASNPILDNVLPAGVKTADLVKAAAFEKMFGEAYIPGTNDFDTKAKVGLGDTPTKAAIKAFVAGTAKDTSDTVAGLTSPVGLGTIAASAFGGELPGVIGKVAAAYAPLAGTAFHLQGAHQVYEAGKDMADKGWTPENVQQGLQGAAAMVGGAAAVKAGVTNLGLKSAAADAAADAARYNAGLGADASDADVAATKPGMVENAANAATKMVGKAAYATAKYATRNVAIPAVRGVASAIGDAISDTATSGAANVGDVITENLNKLGPVGDSIKARISNIADRAQEGFVPTKEAIEQLAHDHYELVDDLLIRNAKAILGVGSDAVSKIKSVITDPVLRDQMIGMGLDAADNVVSLGVRGENALGDVKAKLGTMINNAGSSIKQASGAVVDQIHEAVTNPSGKGMLNDVHDIINQNAGGDKDITSKSAAMASEVMDNIRSSAATSGGVTKSIVNKAVNAVIDKYHEFTNQPVGGGSSNALGEVRADPSLAEGKAPIQDLVNTEPNAEDLAPGMTDGMKLGGKAEEFEMKARGTMGGVGKEFLGKDGVAQDGLRKMIAKASTDPTLGSNANSDFREFVGDGNPRVGDLANRIDDGIASGKYANNTVGGDVPRDPMTGKAIPKPSTSAGPAAFKAWQALGKESQPLGSPKSVHPDATGFPEDNDTTARMQLYADALHRYDNFLNATAKRGGVQSSASSLALGRVGNFIKTIPVLGTFSEHVLDAMLTHAVRVGLIDGGDLNEGSAFSKALSKVASAPANSEAATLFKDAAKEAKQGIKSTPGTPYDAYVKSLPKDALDYTKTKTYFNYSAAQRIKADHFFNYRTKGLQGWIENWSNAAKHTTPISVPDQPGQTKVKGMKYNTAELEGVGAALSGGDQQQEA